LWKKNRVEAASNSHCGHQETNVRGRKACPLAKGERGEEITMKYQEKDYRQGKIVRRATDVPYKKGKRVGWAMSMKFLHRSRTLKREEETRPNSTIAEKGKNLRYRVLRKG